MRRHGALLALLLLWVGCTPAPAPPAAAPASAAAPVTAQGWPAADALFRSDPRWLGGDSAYSVPLDGRRVLWLFGDSFVSTRTPHTRHASVLIRNSVGIQEGADPSQARMQFHWRTDADGTPASFVPDRGAAWFWPLHGIRRAEGLTLFLLRERASPGEPMGFETEGWEAVRIPEPDTAPPSWELQRLEPFDSPFPVAVGASVLEADGHVFAYAVEEPGDHDVYLLRWDADDFTAGRLAEAQWWNGVGGWVPRGALVGPPSPVFRQGASELSVSFSELMGRYVAVHSGPFGDNTLVIRTAPAPEGPWSGPTVAHRPAEAARPGAFVYAAKAHPWLRGADLVVTYATNTLAPSALMTQPDLYYPRFVRLRLRRR